jgi:DNA invertase Pin-like site-specific DNA recombinase
VAVGVDRQWSDNRKGAEFLGLPEPVRFTDQDRSASEFRTKERERWEDLLDAVRAGEYAHVLFWLFDRAFRTTDDAARFLAACREGGALIVQTGGWSPRVVNPADPDDVYGMKDAANKAEYEVAKMSMRQKRHKEALAHAGAPHGGKRSFGYEPGMRAVRPDEAETIRTLATRFLAGDSLRSLAAWLNETGVETPTAEARRKAGKPVATWTGPNLRHMLGREYLAGLRVHHGKVIGPGTWEPILPLETHENIRAKLSQPGRRLNAGSNSRRYLLASLMVCDACGAPTRGRPRTGRNEAPAYLCQTGRHVQRSAELVDLEVERAMVKRLARMDVAGVLVDDVEAGELARLTEARMALDQRLADYAAAASTMDPADYAAATRTLRDQGKALDAEIMVARAAVKLGARVLAGATGPAAELAWNGDGTPENPGWDLSRKRAIVNELAEVRLIGGARGGRFHPDDVAILWR